MKLAILTQRFPFSDRTEFVEAEIPAMCRCFEEVVVFSMAGSQAARVSLPENCRAIPMNVNQGRAAMLRALPRLLAPKAIRELAFALTKLKKRNPAHCLKRILPYLYTAPLLKKHIVLAGLNPEDTLYLSYWCSEGAYALALLKQEGKIRHAASRAHGYDCFIERDYIPFRREILANLDEIISISDAGKRSIESNLLPFAPSRHAKISVSRLGVFKGDDKLNPGRSGTGECQIVSCSNAIPVKRLDLLVDALSLIEERTIQWTHFGDGEQLPVLRERAEKKLSHKPNLRVHFAGRVPKEEILAFYAREPVDFFINCSDSEGIPVSIVEAFAYGIPAIARNVGGISEIVSEENGLLLDAQCDARTLKEAICAMSDCAPSEREDKSRAAYQTYRSKFDAQENYSRLYRRLREISNRALSEKDDENR